jgi:hypothetical protein
LFTPYRDLIHGHRVKADLSFREGVEYQLRLISRYPTHLFKFIRDCLNSQVCSDIDLTDPGAYILTKVARNARAS